jgi:plasmid stabilization system protein ParE
LAGYPEIGSVRPWVDPRLRGVRVLPVKEPCRSILILYESTAEGVYIVRVTHGARQLEDLLMGENTP